MIGRLCRARKWREMAEELRTLAALSKRDDVKKTLMGEAERCERMAIKETRNARVVREKRLEAI